MTDDTQPCACLDTINAELAATGHFLLSTMFGKPNIPVLTVMRGDTHTKETRRDRPGKIYPRFCPFCGLKYPEGAGRVVGTRRRPAAAEAAE